MKRRILTSIIVLSAILVWSCDHLGNTKQQREADNRILQQKDGTVSLILDKAARYADASNPSNNTADWNVVISTPGHYKVWLSSATKDTSNLRYANSVKISLLDDRLEANPACDKIVRNSGEVNYPYFRADSYMGSIYVSEPGEYNIQVISEKVLAKGEEAQISSLADDTKLMSVILTPTTR
jgi:hypothetical protein